MKFINKIIFILTLLIISTNLFYAEDIYKVNNFEKYLDSKESILEPVKNKIDLNSKEMLLSDGNCILQINQAFLDLLPGGLSIELPDGFCVEIIEDVYYEYNLILEGEFIFYGNDYVYSTVENNNPLYVLDDVVVRNVIINKANRGIELRNNSKVIDSVVKNSATGIYLLNSSKAIHSVVENSNDGFLAFDNSKIYDSNSELNLNGFLAFDNSRIEKSIASKNQHFGFIFMSTSLGKQLIASDNEIGFQLVENSKIYNSRAVSNQEIGFSLWHQTYGQNLFSKYNTIGISAFWDYNFAPKLNNGAFCNNIQEDMVLENSTVSGIMFITKKPVGFYINQAIFKDCSQLLINEYIYSN
jgi:hypothetical protein